MRKSNTASCTYRHVHSFLLSNVTLQFTQRIVSETPSSWGTSWPPMGDGGGGACAAQRVVCERPASQEHIRQRRLSVPRTRRCLPVQRVHATSYEDREVIRLVWRSRSLAWRPAEQRATKRNAEKCPALPRTLLRFGRMTF